MSPDRDLGSGLTQELDRLRARSDHNRAWSRRLDASSRALAEALAATEEDTADVLDALTAPYTVSHRRGRLAAQARRTAADLRSWAARPPG